MFEAILPYIARLFFMASAAIRVLYKHYVTLDAITDVIRETFDVIGLNYVTQVVM